MKQHSFLKVILVAMPFILNNAFAYDFVKMKSREVWKVKECSVVDEAYKVKPCFSNNYCENNYPIKDYSCLDSTACDEIALVEAIKKSNTKMSIIEYVPKEKILIRYQVSDTKNNNVTKTVDMLLDNNLKNSQIAGTLKVISKPEESRLLVGANLAEAVNTFAFSQLAGHSQPASVDLPVKKNWADYFEQINKISEEVSNCPTL